MTVTQLNIIEAIVDISTGTTAVERAMNELYECLGMPPYQKNV